MTPLKDILTASVYLDDVCSNVSDFMAKNPECADCPHAAHCCGGCRAMGVGADGTDFFRPDPRVCEFYKNGWSEKFKAVGDRELARFAENGGIERGRARKTDRSAMAEC